MRSRVAGATFCHCADIVNGVVKHIVIRKKYQYIKMLKQKYGYSRLAFRIPDGAVGLQNPPSKKKPGNRRKNSSMGDSWRTGWAIYLNKTACLETPHRAKCQS